MPGGQLHPAGERAEPLAGKLLGLLARLVDRGQDEVFQRADVVGIDRLGGVFTDWTTW